MTLVVTGDEFVIEQVTKQLHKLIDVIKVSDLTDDDHVERELMLIRVNAEPQHREEILRTAEDRKSTRLNSSHDQISYAVFCLKKKIKLILHVMSNDAP